MPSPDDDPRDRRPLDDEPESNLPPVDPFIDRKTQIKKMIQDYNVAPYLKPDQKFWLGTRIVGLGIVILREKVPDDKKLEEYLKAIKARLDGIQPPDITTTAGMQEDMPVEVISTPDAKGGVDKPLVQHALEIREQFRMQTFEKRVKELDFLVQEVFSLLVLYKYLPDDIEEDEPDVDEGLDFGDEERETARKRRLRGRGPEPEDDESEEDDGDDEDGDEE